MIPLPRPAVFSALAALIALLVAPSSLAGTAVDIPFESFTLPNGLTVIVHEDHKAPIVAVDLWYHVGSKDEVTGKTGFAHLFEHLMFQGSEHHKGEYFKPFEVVGTTNQNGTTDTDRTNFFETVPTTAVDMALWMESDRMGHLLGAIDQALLDEQRGVVQNEKRQRENQPYGRVWETLLKASFPAGHPYQWLPIGSMADLNAASLDDVKNWFRNFYGASNVTLVLAGDIDLATAKEKAAKYFGHIASGPPITRRSSWIAARSETRSDLMYDHVAQTRIYRSWNIPGVRDPDSDLLTLLGQVLGGSAASRLDERLVHKDQIADSVGAGADVMEIAGLFFIQVEVKAGVDPARVEAVLDEELRRLLAEGPTPAELARTRTVFKSGFVRGLERIGGGGGKAETLAACAVYNADPGCFRDSLALLDKASVVDLRDVARRWLSKGDYRLTVLPAGDFHNSPESALDRSTGVPAVTEFPSLRFPPIERATLSNGIPIVLAQRHSVPVVNVQLLFDAGYAADQGRKPGTASFATGMLDEGAGSYSSLQLRARAEQLGAGVGGGSGLDTSSVGLDVLKENLDPGLSLFADVVLRPHFDPAEIERVRKQWLAGIAQEKTQPGSMAQRVLPPLLFGAGHAYAMPLTGSGTEASIAALTRDDLLAFQRDWLRPDNARLVVVGDASMDEIKPLLEKYFAAWKPAAGPRPSKNIAPVELPKAARVFLIDRPDAVQTTILAGQVAPSTKAANNPEIGTMNAVLGGIFTSRLNMNLREDKHWAYGASSGLVSALGQRTWIASASVQADKSAESMTEMRKELVAYVGDRPATEDEIAKIKDRDVRALPGQYETAAAVLGAVDGILIYDRPDDYVLTQKARIENQTADNIRAAAREVIHPDALTWVVVGDLKKIEQPIRALNFGTVQVMDVDGKVVRE